MPEENDKASLMVLLGGEEPAKTISIRALSLERRMSRRWGRRSMNMSGEPWTLMKQAHGIPKMQSDSLSD